MRAAAFEAYVEHLLAPTLGEGQVVVLDGLGAHRTDKVRELIEARGAELLFLPSRLTRLTSTPKRKRSRRQRTSSGRQERALAKRWSKP